jgi:hypothetical protein
MIKTNEMNQFLKLIFGIELYMFRTGFLSIIRSLALYTQQYMCNKVKWTKQSEVEWGEVKCSIGKGGEMNLYGKGL